MLNFVALKPIVYIAVFLILSATSVRSQSNDSLPFRMFKSDVILATDLGFYSAPFSLKDNYNLGVNRIKFKNNPKLVLGLGFAYKWFSFRLGFALPVDLRSTKKFEETNYFDVGLRFSIKQTYSTLEFRNYQGFTIKNASHWNDSLDSPNQFRAKTSSINVSANVYYFKSKSFNFKAAMGKAGHYTGSAQTWYFKSSLNFFGVINEAGSLVPVELTDSSDRTNASSVGALDMGFIPGYAYANRINNWQFAIFGGLGGVIQSKYYTYLGTTRSFLGIAPRLDFRLIVGYSRPRYFLILSGDFDIKSAQIQDLTYNQTYYNVRLTSGFRIKTKASKEN